MKYPQEFKKLMQMRQESEQGIALVLVLLMGFLLIAGSSALLVRKLVERKVGAFASYQQMAENAAISGFNHILSQLNNPSQTQYKGYLYEIDNFPTGDMQWVNINETDTSKGIELEEICTPTLGSAALPEHPEEGKTWPIDLVPLANNTSDTEFTLRDDGSKPVEAYYRLREFDSSFASDQATGVFSIEGLIKRQDTVLARTLLTRSLDIKFVVANDSDWAIVNAALFKDIQSLKIEGEGIILANKNMFWKKNCNQQSLENEIASNVAGSTSPLVWPVRERGIPGPVLYEEKRQNDVLDNQLRVWSFDDSSLLDRGSNCTEVACVRKESQTSKDSFVNANSTGSITEDASDNTIILKEDGLCDGGEPGSPCHINIEYLNLNNTKLLIENEDRPIVIHLLSPNTTSPSPSSISTGSIQLKNGSMLCGVNINSSECNNKPEHLIIANGPNDGDYQNGCSAMQGKLSFGSQNLPAALITLQSGTVSIDNDTSIRGLIWAQNICGNNNRLTINSAEVIQDTEKAWKWRENNLWGGNGRQTIRGIRGSGMDLFEKF